MARRKPYPSDVSDLEWQLIKGLLPDQAKVGHPRKVNQREIVNGILYVHREGCSWRALPHDLPPWQTVYSYQKRWERMGILPKILKFRPRIIKKTS